MKTLSEWWDLSQILDGLVVVGRISQHRRITTRCRRVARATQPISLVAPGLVVRRVLVRQLNVRTRRLFRSVTPGVSTHHTDTTSVAVILFIYSLIQHDSHSILLLYTLQSKSSGKNYIRATVNYYSTEAAAPSGYLLLGAAYKLLLSVGCSAMLLQIALYIMILRTALKLSFHGQL